MFVLTVDQINSTGSADRVPELLAEIAEVDTVLPFERTVGDEVQAVMDSHEAVIEACIRIARPQLWTVGIGVGTVDEPLAPRAPESRGEAFVAARQAVEHAKHHWSHMCMAHGAGLVDHTKTGSVAGATGIRHDMFADAQTALRLLMMLVGQTTLTQWKIIDHMRGHPNDTQTNIAATFGVTQQAVSKVRRAGLADAIAETTALSYRALARLGHSQDQAAARSGEADT